MRFLNNKIENKEININYGVNRNFPFFILFSVLFLSLNLRAPITSTTVLLEVISESLGINGIQSGLIMTTPLIIFAISSVIISNMGVKYGYTKMVILSCLFLLVGEMIRVSFGYKGLLIGTGFIGLGISFGNVLIPSIIKLKFPKHLGIVTGLYGVVMGLFSSISTGLTLHLVDNKGLNWRYVLSIWIILSLITLIIWLSNLFIKKDKMDSDCDKRSLFKRKDIYKSKTTWAIIVYMGAQSFMFYTYITWLPKILLIKGFDSYFSGTMMSLFQMAAIPFSLLIPVIASKMKNQKAIATFVALAYLLGSIFIYISNSKLQVISSIVIMAIGSSGTYSAAIILMELRSKSSSTVAIVSGLSQSLGYLLASVGPVLMGYLFDIYESIDFPMIIFILVSFLLVLSGITAGKEGYIDE